MLRCTIKTLSRFGVIGLALALSAGTGWAASYASQAAQFSDQQLRSVAQVAVQLHQIAVKAQATLKTKTTDSEKEAVAQQLEAQQIQAVKAGGLTVKLYNEITSAARTNPQVRIKLTHYLEKASPHLAIVAASIPR